ncbi:MAG TPA: energy-coupling factor transporter transmembrane component T [Candidatus Margulisiibacteriota bacterium]|nr:energy-coupling factor transporter transmembrane component T [Candidatus Margulisiibacteriota bacterium]
MPLFLYIDRPTALHRLNPTVKVLGMLCFFVAAFVTQAPVAALPVAALVSVLITMARAWPNVRRLRFLFLMVFVMTFVIWTLFFRGGEPVLVCGPVRISAAGLRFALGMAIKLDTLLGVGIVFLSTTKIEEFAYALTRVGIPYKLGFTMTLAFRLVPVFLDAGATVVQAQRCRGFNFDEGNLLQRMRRYVPVIVPVFMGALRRADGMAMALEARGFQAHMQRSAFEHFPFRRSDAAALLAAVAVAALYVTLAYFGYTSVPR